MMFHGAALEFEGEKDRAAVDADIANLRAALEGARVIEVKVNHRPRVRGTSKYSNLRRGVEGFYDVLSVRWMIRRNLTLPIRESNVV